MKQIGCCSTLSGLKVKPLCCCLILYKLIALFAIDVMFCMSLKGSQSWLRCISCISGKFILITSGKAGNNNHSSSVATQHKII